MSVRSWFDPLRNGRWMRAKLASTGRVELGCRRSYPRLCAHIHDFLRPQNKSGLDSPSLSANNLCDGCKP